MGFRIISVPQPPADPSYVRSIINKPSVHLRAREGDPRGEVHVKGGEPEIVFLGETRMWWSEWCWLAEAYIPARHGSWTHESHPEVRLGLAAGLTDMEAADYAGRQAHWKIAQRYARDEFPFDPASEAHARSMREAVAVVKAAAQRSMQKDPDSDEG